VLAAPFHITGDSLNFSSPAGPLGCLLLPSPRCQSRNDCLAFRGRSLCDGFIALFLSFRAQSLPQRVERGGLLTGECLELLLELLQEPWQWTTPISKGHGDQKRMQRCESESDALCLRQQVYRSPTGVPCYRRRSSYMFNSLPHIHDGGCQQAWLEVSSQIGLPVYCCVAPCWHMPKCWYRACMLMHLPQGCVEAW
jgi:hypothetical protein